MTWTKLDDSFYDCPEVVFVKNEAAGAYARSLSYCGKHNTDGKILKPIALSTLCEGKQRVADKLLEVGLWVEDGLHYVIPGYLDYNPSAKQVEKDRAAAKKRMRELRANGSGSS